MKLMTKEIEKKIVNAGSSNYGNMNAPVIVKYFGGCVTWLVVGGEWVEEQGNYRLFGYASIGYGYEWGTIWFKELDRLKIPPFGLPLERDLYRRGTVKELVA